MVLMEFGECADGATYIPRTCVYGVAIDARNCVLVATFKGRLVLPGGGIEAGERESQTLVREALEETGCDVVPGPLLGRARQWVTRPEVGKYRDKACAFYRMRVVAHRGPPTDPRHVARWLPAAAAATDLHYGSHRWAVERAVRDTTGA